MEVWARVILNNKEGEAIDISLYRGGETPQSPRNQKWGEKSRKGRIAVRGA